MRKLILAAFAMLSAMALGAPAKASGGSSVSVSFGYHDPYYAPVHYDRGYYDGPRYRYDRGYRDYRGYRGYRDYRGYRKYRGYRDHRNYRDYRRHERRYYRKHYRHRDW